MHKTISVLFQLFCFSSYNSRIPAEASIDLAVIKFDV